MEYDPREESARNSSAMRAVLIGSLRLASIADKRIARDEPAADFPVAANRRRWEMRVFCQALAMLDEAGIENGLDEVA